MNNIASGQQRGHPALRIVVVRHGLSPIDPYLQVLKRQIRSTAQVSWCVVDTATSFQHNRAFEFSGYEVGMRDLHGKGSAELTRVVFLNDTAFLTHIQSITRLILHHLSDFDSWPCAPNTLYGIRTAIPESEDWPEEFKHYAPTWLFALDCRTSELPRVTLLTVNSWDGNHVDQQISRRGQRYDQWITTWLSPVSFFKGWHKANWGVALTRAELERKRFTIFTEHSMPATLARQGFAFVDFRAHLPRSSARVLSVLLVMDRLILNVYKLRLRTGNLISRQLHRRRNKI